MPLDEDEIETNALKSITRKMKKLRVGQTILLSERELILMKLYLYMEKTTKLHVVNLVPRVTRFKYRFLVETSGSEFLLCQHDVNFIYSQLKGDSFIKEVRYRK